MTFPPEWFLGLGLVSQAVVAGSATWLLTASGATPVFLVRSAPRWLMDSMLGFAGGVMVAAACWSLLVPALDMGGVLPAVVGLGVGAAFIFAMDQLLPHLHPPYGRTEDVEGISVAWRRSVLLVTAITLHNIPEGLAVGVAFGGGDVTGATVLALGIGIQNIPEGLAVALPLRREGFGRFRAFWYGQMSAVVEPVAALGGVVLVLRMRALLPYALAFAAGAMLYVVVEELLPESERGEFVDLATLGFLLGFTFMMALDNAVG